MAKSVPQRRNKNAGKGPNAGRKQWKGQKAYNATPAAKKKRAEANKKRREAKGNIDGKDYDHAVKKFVSSKTNRGRKGEGNRVKKSRS